MRKFAGTIVALVVFAALLAWVLTQERGRVPEKEELLANEVIKAGGIVGIEAIKYDLASIVNADKDDEDEASEAASAEEDAEPAAEEQTDETAGKDAEKSEKKEKEDPQKRVELRRFAIEKQGDEWHITKPFRGLADPDKVKTMVKALERLKPTVREDADLTNKDFALDNPTLKVTAQLDNGSTLAITLGERTPVGAKIYAKIDGHQGLYLIPSMFTNDFEREADKIRDKKLARFEKDDVTSVTFVNEHGTIEAEKKKVGEDVKWTITNPGPYKGDEWAISSAFGKIGEVEAKEFAAIPKKLSEFGLDKPRARCTIHLKDGKSYEVLVGKQITKKVKTSEYSDTTEEKELVYAMRKGRDEVLLVETTLFDDLNKDLMAMRDNRILDFKRDRVAKLRVSQGEGYSFTAVRAGDDWKLQTPEVGDAKKTKIDDILWDLSDLEAKEYLGKAADLKKLGLAVPSTVITLELTGNKTIKVKFGDSVEKDGEKTYYCMVDDEKEVYRVGQLVINDLPKGTEDIKEGAEPTTGGKLPDLSGHGSPPTTTDASAEKSGASPSK